MSENIPLNPGIYKVHRIFFIAFAAFAVLMVIAGLSNLLRGGSDASIAFMGAGLLPLMAAHWYAAKGAKEGKTYGLVLSRMIGTLWLVGFPIGTVLGMYVWLNTGKKWKQAS